ncbi:MAG: hypothetical protein KC478_06920 [Bacteriovoracaceae bacterium]|nr:hypothetical protein [Bacteriovoracaceae bacterium]
MKLMTKAFVFTMMINSAWGFSGDHQPKWMVDNAQEKFSSLPKHGQLSTEKTPWSSSFWPHIYGGITFRWNNFYDKPSFAPLHVRIEEIDEEISKLQKSLFVEGNSVAHNKEIVEEIAQLNQEKLSVNFEKSKGHDKYFFQIDRPQRMKELKNFSQEQLDKLSPAEKFDVYMYLTTGKDNGFKLTKDVLDVTSPSDAYWEGICNGWSSAALEFKEPKAQTISANGITLNLGSSDLKALLSYYHAAITNNWVTAKRTNTGRVGERCETAFAKEAWFIKDGVEYYKSIEDGAVIVKPVPEECVDTNPGTFHIVLANLIGIQNEGFVAEVVRDSEVWNQPVYKYDTTIVSEKSRNLKYATKGTRKQVEVKTTMHYANDGGRMFWVTDGTDDEFYAWWDQTTGTGNYRADKKEFHYILDLDRSGKIIGGRWLSYERPDFLWLKKQRGFMGEGMLFGIVSYLDALKDLVELQDK